MLAACQPAGTTVPRQVVVDWPEEHLVFVADIRLGRVQSFRMRAGAPRLLAQTPGIRRASLRDIRLEPEQNKLWVLGNNGVYLYEARGLVLQRHFPLAAQKVSALRVDADRVLLLDKSGTVVGQIDSQTLVASWRPVLERG